MEKESATRFHDNVLLQSTIEINQETTTRYNNSVGADLSTNVAATSLDTNLEQKGTYSQESQQTKTKHIPQDYSCSIHSTEDMLIRSKQLQDGRVPEAIQRLAATKVDNSKSDRDLERVMDVEMIQANSTAAMLIRSKQLQDGRVPKDLQRFAGTKVDSSNSDRDLERVMDYVTKQAKKADAVCNKHDKHTSLSLSAVDSRKSSEAAEQRSSLLTPTTAAIQHQQPPGAATMPTLTASSRPLRPIVLPTSAEDSVRRHYVLPKAQTTASSLIAHSAVNSLSQQSNDVNNASDAQPEDLLVAVLIEEDKVDAYAVSHDVSHDEVRKRIQMIRARCHSRRLYFAVFLVVAAAFMIASIVVITTNKSDGQEQEQETEMTVLQNITQLIMSIMGAEAVLLNDASSPYAKALSWLLQSIEENESQEMTSTLAQRFYAASFYYDTTTDDDKWSDCNPPNSSSVLNQTCINPYNNREKILPGVKSDEFRIENSNSYYEVDPILLPYNNTAQAWLSNSHECQWSGVFCDNHQQIIGLGFDNMNLVGTIPSSVAKFPFLYLLWSTFSRLEGNISLLSDCHHLTFVYLDYNMLSGDLSVLWQNRKIMVVEFVNNNFTGSLSSQVGNLVDITFFSVYGNELTGTIPSEVGLFDSMYHFDIGNNYFRGELPSTMQYWSKIEYFVVSGNSLSGSIPTFLGHLNKTLLYLFLSDNQFTGTLPDELFHLSELLWMDVANNELSGTLDARFAQLTSSQLYTSIVKLYLSGNHFTGTIPTELGLLTNLANINLQGNDFHGNVSASLCQDLISHFDFKLVADCANDDNGRVELQCDCCTTCCQADGTQCKPK